MEKNNITTIVLLGFPGLHHFRILFFAFLLIIYSVTICGNLLVILLVSYSKTLHTPMYFFLTQLTTLDIILTSDIVPNMLRVVWESGSSISLLSCFTQLFFFGTSEVSEIFILTVMSYDRYLAICDPLHYDSVMTPELCLKYSIISWLIGFSVSLTFTVLTSRVPLCRSNVIDHFFCEINPILELSCSSTFRIKLLITLICILVLVFPFVIVVISYVSIVHTILGMPSINHRQKAFSTCGSHLAVVSIFYGTLIFTYLIPKNEKNNSLHKFFSIFYTVLTPLSNPVIYCLRNQDIKKAFQMMTFSQCSLS